MRFYAIKPTFLIIFLTFYCTTQSYNITTELHNLAKECVQKNNIKKALSYYKQVLRLDPSHFEAAFEIANIFYNNQQAKDALVHYKQALKQNNNHPEIYYNLGLCHLKLENSDEAYAAFQNAHERNPHYIKAYIQCATIHMNKKEYHQALTLYQQALKHNPRSFDLYYRMGSVLRSLEQYHDAIAIFEKALDLNPTSTHAMLEIANTLHMVDNYERSLSFYQQALERNPSCNEALYNFGYTLKKCGDVHKARDYTEKSIIIHTQVIEQKPDYPLAHFSRSLSYLTLGNFEKGWPEYEWRWAAYNEKPKSFPQPTWSGQDLMGKRIFIYAEQGFGDTFQFIRYGKILKDMGAYVIAQTQHHLKTIIAQCPYLDEVVSDREPIPAFDYHCALMSIPMVVRTTIETVPNEIPYLHADHTLVSEWHQKLSTDKNFKIGICWQGNKQYRNVYLKKEVAGKAMELSTFAPLASLPSVSLYSLQKINGTEQLDTLDNTMHVHTFGADFDESNGRFMDTAAIIKNLDLVITIDTSICHLAAGLGTEVWVLLPFPADWRWMLETSTTPWYPNMRLFRQPNRGDWACVIKDVTTALQEKIGTKQSPNQLLDDHKKKLGSNCIASHESTDAQDYFSTDKEQIESEQLGTIVNNMTLCSLEMQHSNNAHHARSLAADHIHLQNTYQPYKEKSDDLHHLTQQLLLINQRLWDLDKQIPTIKSLFQASSKDLIQEINCLYNVKNIITQKINSIAAQLKEEVQENSSL